MSKIDTIHTPCKKCIFAVYDGKTQTDCYMGKIDEFKKRNIEVLEVYDDNQEFFVINKKRCLSFRDKTWLDNKVSLSLEESKVLVQQENLIKYIAVIYLENNTTLEHFTSLVVSLMNQKIPPKGIMIVRNQYEKYAISIKEITPILNGTNIHWRLQNFIDESMTNDHKIKAIIKSAPLDRFYYLIYPSKYIDNNFSEIINNFIDSGGTFGCININDNLFFSYLTFIYAQNLNDINILESKDTHTKYETIS